jgi:hypothetical protein
MIGIGWVVVLVVLVGVLCLGAVMLGAFLMFRGKQQSGGGGFFKEPRGAVFSIPDADLDVAITDEEQILSNTERFLKTLGG